MLRVQGYCVVSPGAPLPPSASWGGELGSLYFPCSEGAQAVPGSCLKSFLFITGASRLHLLFNSEEAVK